jgi:hypothetical protein
LAIREFRYSFNGKDRALTKRLHDRYGSWIPGFRQIMKGRYKEFSGPEVKGVSMVNFNLNDIGYLNSNRQSNWLQLINVIEKDVECDLVNLENISTIDGFIEIYKIFDKVARSCLIPQIAKMPDLLIGELTLDNIQRIAQLTNGENSEFKEFIRSKEYVYGTFKKSP